jgi:hypothetical protein
MRFHLPQDLFSLSCNPVCHSTNTPDHRGSVSGGVADEGLRV